MSVPIRAQCQWVLAFLALSSSLAGDAHAEQVVTNNYGWVTKETYLQGGTQSLAFSYDMLGILDVGQIQVDPYSNSEVTANKDADGAYTQVSTKSSVVSLQVQDNTAQIEGINAIGGLTLTTSGVKSISTGGMLTLSDLHIDTQTREISSTLIGANGVGTRLAQPIWQATDIQTALVQLGRWDGNLYFYDYTVTLTGLNLTDNGRAAFNLALGLQTLGQSALQFYSANQGTLTTKMLFLAPEGFSPSVPEPATWATLCLGLIGVLGATRRRSASGQLSRAWGAPQSSTD